MPVGAQLPDTGENTNIDVRGTVVVRCHTEDKWHGKLPIALPTGGRICGQGQRGQCCGNSKDAKHNDVVAESDFLQGFHYSVSELRRSSKVACQGTLYTCMEALSDHPAGEPRWDLGARVTSCLKHCNKQC
jgi:hypothetical protein